jgi:putative ABC transport system permease protein
MLDDLRDALRRLRRTPGFTLIAVLTLALGIAANVAFFSVVDALVYAPVRAANLGGVYGIDYSRRTGVHDYQRLSPDLFRTLEAHPPDSVAGLCALQWGWAVTVQIPGMAATVRPELVTGGYAQVFDARPEVGRFIGYGDDHTGGADVVVISDRLWRDWFAANPAVVGRTTITVNRHPFRLVGVAPPGFRGSTPAATDVVGIWLPLSSAPALWNGRTLAMFTQSVSAYVKLHAGVSATQAAGALRALTGASDHPGAIGTAQLALQRADRVNSSMASLGFGVLTLAGFVLLAACANLANLLYARGAERRGEVAIRLSLGASGGRIFRLVFAESAAIAGLATALGLALAFATMTLFVAAFPAIQIGRTTMSSVRLDLGPNVYIVLYALAAGTVSALLVGVATAWRASRRPPLRTLAAGGAATGVTARGRYVRAALVAVQVTAAVVLVMGAGLVLASYARQMDRRVQFDIGRQAHATVDLRVTDENETEGRLFYGRVLDRLGHEPGVEAAALASTVPSNRYGPGNATVVAPDPAVHVGGYVTHRINATVAVVSPGFLRTMGVALTRGRDLHPSDRGGAPLVAVVSESVARTLWPGEDPLGRHLTVGRDVTVVGVSADPVASSLDSPLSYAGAYVFVPFDQHYQPDMQVLVRAENPAAELATLRSVIRGVDDSVPIFDVSTLEESTLAWVKPLRAVTLLMAALGAIALGIAVLGIYGVVSFLVSARTREFGIRMALGATRRRIAGMVIDHATSLLLIGLLPGVYLVSIGTNVIWHYLPGTMPNGVTTWVAVPLLILAVGLLAAYIPARRAARLDPNVALREL